MPSQGWVMNHRWSPPSRSQHFSRESDDGQGRGLLGGPSAYWARRQGGFLEYALPSCVQDARHRGREGPDAVPFLNCHMLDRERWETTLEDSRDLEARQGSRSRQRAGGRHLFQGLRSSAWQQRGHERRKQDLAAPRPGGEQSSGSGKGRVVEGLGQGGCRR